MGLLDSLWAFLKDESARRGRDLYERAQEDPESVAVEEPRDLLTADNQKARARAAGTLAVIADDRPEDVRPAVGDLRALLDDADQTRGNAAWALGGVA